MPKKNKTLCVDDLRHAEYYGMQPVFDELYHRSLEGENFTDLMDLILSRDNILLAYRNIKANGGSYTAGTDNKNISDIGLRYESDRKAGSTSCNLISVTKSWNWKGKNWWNRRNELPDLQREKDLWTKYGCTIQWFWEYRIIFNLPPASALIAGKSTDRS